MARERSGSIFRSVVAPLALLTLAGVAAAPAHGQDVEWPGFRGPMGNGVSDGAAHPMTWAYTADRKENIAWVADVPGASWASPIVVGETVYVISAVTPEMERPIPFRGAGGGDNQQPAQEATFELLAYDLASGGAKWSKTVATKVPEEPTHPSNTFATESPVTNGKHIFMHFGSIGLVAAYDLEGNEAWRREIGAYAHANGFGTGSSLALAEGTLVVLSDNQEDSFILGLDAATGEERWRQPRAIGSSWASPVVVAHGGRTQVIAPGTGAVTSYNAATGEVIWKATGTPNNFSASPVVANGRVVVGTRGLLISIDLNAMGEFAASTEDPSGFVRWSTAGDGLSFSSPTVLNGAIYGARGAFFGANDLDTGARVYRDRLPDQSEVVSSAWTSGGMVFVLNENGTAFGIKPGQQLEVVHTNVIEGDLFSGTPSVARGSLLIRGADKLYCIRAAGG